MRRLIYSLVILSMCMFACNIASTVTPTVVIPPTVIAPATVGSLTPPSVIAQATVAPATLVGPTALIPTLTSTTTPITANVSCNNLSLYFDPALGSGFNCETITEVPEGIIVVPQYTKITLQGYVLSGKFYDPQIMVFPVKRYTELLPDFMAGNVTELQNFIAGAMPDNSAMPFGSSLPFLPTLNAGQIFHSQYLTQTFHSGEGIRYLTLLAQSYAVINNHDMFYTYQGITTDGLYWVSAILPVTNPILPENGDTLPGGVTYDQFTSTYTSYATGIINQLNSQTSGSYSPSLEALDTLVSSITVQP